MVEKKKLSAKFSTSKLLAEELFWGKKANKCQEGYSGGHKNYHNTVCPKVPVNSNMVDFSAISGPILKPFDLQVAILGRFDMMYDLP